MGKMKVDQAETKDQSRTRNRQHAADTGCGRADVIAQHESMLERKHLTGG